MSRLNARASQCFPNRKIYTHALHLVHVSLLWGIQHVLQCSGANTSALSPLLMGFDSKFWAVLMSGTVPNCYGTRYCPFLFVAGKSSTENYLSGIKLAGQIYGRRLSRTGYGRRRPLDPIIQTDIWSCAASSIQPSSAGLALFRTL